MPTCGSDADCSPGLFCSLEFGVCVDEEPTGSGIGDECDPEDDECEGFCLNFGSTAEPFYQCTALCTFGALGCGLDPAAETQPGDPLCLPLFSQFDDVGDAGLCIQRCDCDDDCLHENSVCDPFNDASIEAALEAQGFCIQRELAASDAGVVGLSCESTPDEDGGMMTPVDSGMSTPDAAAETDSGADGG
jgi:hypothetical protein